MRINTRSGQRSKDLKEEDSDESDFFDREDGHADPFMKEMKFTDT